MMRSPDRLLTVISWRRVVCPDGMRPAAVHVAAGRIAAVTRHDDCPSSVDVEDVGEKVLMPSLVDTHVRIDEHGRTEWEGFDYATKGTAAGGYTTLVDMPLNGTPATTTVAALRLKAEAAYVACYVDCGFWGGIVPGNTGDLARLAEQGVLGFKCFLTPAGIERFDLVVRGDLEAAMPIVAAAGLPVLAHCELPAVFERASRAIDENPGAY